MPLDLNGPGDVPYVPLRDRMKGHPLKAWIEAAAVAHADRIAIDDGNRSFRYGDVWLGACRMAQVITRTMPEGQPIAVVLPNVATYPMAWLGCLLAGRPAALLDSHYPPERNRQCLETTRPAGMIGSRNDTAAREIAGHLPYLEIESAFDEAIPAVPPHRPANDDDTAFIIFTSGSTGRPKGLAAAALNRATTLIDSVHMNPNDAVLSAIPPCALGGMLNVLETFLAGATLLKLDLPRAYLSTHANKGTTMLFATPALLRVIAQLDTGGAIRRGLRVVQPIGDSLLQADMRQLRAEMPSGCFILNAYGSSEALVSLQWFLPDPYTLSGAKIGSGYRVPGYDCALLNEDGGAAAIGEPGELVVRSRHMSLGEWRDGALHPGPFLPDPDDPGLSVHHTGDLATLSQDGLFTVVGRRDRQVKIRGNRIEPAEVEETLRSLKGVKEAAVVARIRDKDPELLAFVVAAEPAVADMHDRLTSAMLAALPPYMQPSRLVFLSSLPLLPGGKIDVAKLLLHARD